MSSRTLLRWILLVQALAALGIGAAGMRWLGLTGWQAAALGLGSVALVRLVINVNNFLLSARAASPTPPAFQIAPGAALRMAWEEFSTSMLMTSWHMPRAQARTRLHPGAAAPPVLLVHGYGCNSGYWAYLAPLLDAARISHATLDLEPLTGDIDGYAARIEEAAGQLCAQAGAAQLIVVAHSMGGLAARAWMRTHGAGRVARLITLGTPHHGTCLAAFGLGINAGQMRRMGVAGPDCAWLTALAGGEAPEIRARIVSIYSHHDNIIAPQTSSELPGARNLALGGVGHVALGRNPRVLAMVMGEIEALRSDRAAPAATPHRRGIT
ncbi:triacylglycerol esterase/lipase EstA (alpha/beta hydrolase family) [Massilia sp. UYP11]|uniref:esterase/lipase family protein n=1 Tax=Massilia sp. UYP11 TaxID=1756385 RepID=UPI003D1D614A